MLLYLKNADGTPFVQGKTITGFANAEEGHKVQSFWIKTEAKKPGANFVTADKFKPFAVRDGNLINGQQQNSGRETARLVIEMLETGDNDS